MKKFISIVLSLVVLSTMLLGFEITANAAISYCHLSLYKNEFKKIYKSCYKNKKYIDNSRAFYYDFDGNGQKELVIIATKKKSKKIGAYLYLYTIQNGKVKSIIKNRRLAYYSGEDCPAQIGLAKKKGKQYLFVRTVAIDSETESESTIKLYNIKGSKVTCKYTAISTAKFNNKSDKWKVNVKINSKKKSNKFFMKWQKSFKLKFVGAKENKKGYKKYFYYNDFNVTKNLMKSTSPMKKGIRHFKKGEKSKTFNVSKFNSYNSSYTGEEVYSNLSDGGADGTYFYCTDYFVDSAGRYHWDEFGHFGTDKDLELI